MSDTLRAILADLTGEGAPIEQDMENATQNLMARSGLGYSQLNELLLLLGYDRVSQVFFQFLIDGSAKYCPGAAFKSLGEMRKGVDRFRVLAILRFGNVKFGFKHLSAPSTDLAAELDLFAPVDPAEFSRRHDPLVPIDPIPGDETYFLGYLIKCELDARLEQNPDDEAAKKQLQYRQGVLEKGKSNHEAYLASDHMDVYVATSMRERHEYQITRQVVKDVFSSAKLTDLKLRWFDPTQAYCEDRIDKGLAEGLMLKRAACTLYLAQESDTLGKDSELATTLAQGKPVIAYIASVADEDSLPWVNRLLAMVAQGSASYNERELVLEQLRLFCPEAAWKDREVMEWVASPDQMDLGAAKHRLADCVRTHYDTRAKTLKQLHPLGIQVHLDTGVACGVLVARSTEQCADLIRRILTRTLEFKICGKSIDGRRYLLLKETTTDSVYRVVTGDRFLTNAFWNFYLGG